MTLVTHSQFADSRGATKGARRATEVASRESAGGRSSCGVIKLSDRSVIDSNRELLPFNVDRRHSVFVCRLRRHLELLTEDVQHQITSDETHQVIPPTGGLRQRAFG